MAKVKEIRIGMSRKISDDNYGSMGVQGEIFLVLEDDDDKDEMWAFGTSWLSAKLAGTHKAHGTVSSQPEPKEIVREVIEESGIGGDTSDYTNIKGKPHKLCTIHNEWMPQRENEKGKWFSHKDGDDWCRGE